MPATGLKIVGTGACLPWCSISSSFKNSLKTSGHLHLDSFGVVPYLPDIGFQLLKSSWSSLTYFSFNDAPNVLYRVKIWTADRPIQHPVSSTTKPCCCNSCSMWFSIVLLKYTSSGGEHMLLNAPFRIHSAFQNVQAAHTICTYAPHTSEMLHYILYYIIQDIFSLVIPIFPSL